MSRIGIIAEFNPFHNGHGHLIEAAREGGNSVICAVGGNFVQRGDIAVIRKHDRAAAALSAGADLVCEIPSVYTMTTAQCFAQAGVWQLYNLGCDKIIFGSESGDTAALIKIADIIMSDRFSFELAKLKKSGETFAKSREKALLACGADITPLNNPNDNLGIEYILAAKRLRLNISFEAVRRTGTEHNSDTPDGEYASGSYIRKLITSGDFEAAKRFTPEYTHHLLSADKTADISRIERTLLGILRCKEEEDFSHLPDLSEGIENRLFEAIKTASSLDMLYSLIKTKRYTLSRVRRLVLSAALGFDGSFFMTTPPYTRILGASNTGLGLLKNTVSLCPVISRASDISMLDKESKKLFLSECRATDIYALAFKTPLPKGLEYTEKFIKKEQGV